MTTSEPDGRSLGHRVLQRDGGKPFEGSTAESIKQAEHLLRSGRLEDARQQFRALVSSADIEGEPGLLARAAIGFGGAWVNEIRLTDERAEFLGTLRRALAALGPDDDVSRVRLEARLAAEQYYDGGTNEPVFDALARARGLRGPMAARALGETLSLAHHCMLAPERGADRLEIATELVGVAARSGDTDLAAMGLCWRAVDLYLAGHRSAGRAHEELRVRADDAGALHLSYIADVLDVMRTIRAGELAAAEAAAERTFERGVEVGDLDAVGYFGAHLVTIRWLQGRLGEIRPLVESMTAVPTIASNDWIYVAVEAHAAGDDGDLDACRAGLNRLTVEGLDNLPRWSTWTGMMMSTVEGARHLADREVAAACRLLLSDFADLPVMPSLAVTCLGSVRRSLGVAALVDGDPDDAVHHLDLAVRANIALGNRPLTAMARADLAQALHARGRPGDDRAADDALASAIDLARDCQMTRRAEQWADNAPATQAPAAASVRSDGRSSVFSGRDEQATVPDAVGVGFLRALLLNPGVYIHVLDLVSGGEAGRPSVSDHAVIDAEAMDAYRRRGEGLLAELTRAERRGDSRRAESLRSEIDALARHIESATGLRGRGRTFDDAAERARTSVRKAIVRALDRIRNQAPDLAAELADCIETGFECRYVPPAGRPIRWVDESLEPGIEGFRRRPSGDDHRPL